MKSREDQLMAMFPNLTREQVRALQKRKLEVARKIFGGAKTRKSKASLPPGVGDPNAVMPGERPEAYSATLSDEEFFRRFAGSDADVRCLTNSAGEVTWGQPLPGEKIAPGHELDPDGRVVSASR